MMTSGEIRQQFLDFFKAKGHVIVPSSPIVVKDDPTLLFTNAGMNQFKEYFLGNKLPPYARVADSQKCLRVSGKHNDLEEVGVDTYHHTMFEMLGNWSFGDYFKQDAIAWSWELLTTVYNIPIERLFVTVFEGDAGEQLPQDEEAIFFWKKWISEDRIIMGNKKDNFWEMGDTGPCGPCTEIHIDCRTDLERKEIPGKSLVNQDHPQVIEIWNNVFIQYNRKKDGSLDALPSKHVDTGMGFERLVRVIQNKASNYDTDVFSGTIKEVEKLSGKNYIYTNSKPDIAFRVIADHIRAIAFPVADGQLPSNTGAGYVIRRILRRAVRYYFSYLGVKQPLLYKLIPLLSLQFKDVFPGLYKQEEFIARVIYEEEDSFLKTVEKGLQTLDKMRHNITGEQAFKLYDTFGFPLDLTKLVAAEKDLTVDETGFEREMQQQKNRSRAAGVIDSEDWIVLRAEEGSYFVGYDQYETESKVIKYRRSKSQGKDHYEVVLDKTPFYAESGGQVADKGTLIFDEGEIEVTGTKKENDLIIHLTQKLPAGISSRVIARIEGKRRVAIMAHHSATHLMHAALRKVLGNHVAQKGSLVNEEHLRFDFSHFAKVSDRELSKIEALVNEKIRENIPVVIKEMKKEDAVAIGAMALFGEKYGETVRVVIIDPGFSIELCGGTHVGTTGEVGTFKIKHESAVGAGVRRIEAVAGITAEEFITGQFEMMRGIREILKHPKDLQKALETVITENTVLKKQIEKFEFNHLSVLKKQLLQDVEKVNGVNFIGQIVTVTNADSLRKICFALKNEVQDFIILLTANIEGKAFVALMIDDSLVVTKKLDAAKVVKDYIVPLIKGGGGGQKNFATAGGPLSSELTKLIEQVKQLLN